MEKGKNGLGGSRGQRNVSPEIEMVSTRTNKSSERERQRRADLIAKAKERREEILRRIRCEKKTMLVLSVFSLIASLCWIVAVMTDSWSVVELGEDDLRESNSSSGKVFVNGQTGLWRECKTFSTEETWCKSHEFFPDEEEIRRNRLDEHVIDYRRTEICFAVISLGMMGMTLIAAFYTFKNSRYMYKRLAAGLFFLNASTVLVVLEVFITQFRYEKINIPQNFDPELITYGYSFYMGWGVFGVYLITGCVFLVYSAKRKGDKGAEEGADEPQIIGR